MAIFLIAGLVLMAVAVTVVVRATVAPRARTTQNLGQIGHYGFTQTSAQPAKPTGPLSSAVEAIAARLGNLAGGRLVGGDRELELRNTLIGAGLYTVTPRKFTGYRLLATVTGLALGIWFAGSSNALLGVLEVVLLPVFGWMGPMWFVRARAKQRLSSIEYDLPELIDLLVVTVEAGLGFSASLQIAVERLPGALGDELRLVLQEQNMGLALNDALRNMLARCETPGVRSFVRSILQGETLGVSIGQIMRNLATEMRKRRRAAAEERAQKAPIKILFPLVFLIFPALFVILLGPAVYSFMKAFGG